MTDFEIIDAGEVEFKAPEKKKKKTPAKSTPVNKVQDLETIEASSTSQELKDGYKPLAGKPRIYEVKIETVDYNKSGRKINYSHTIKYPGWAEFFEEEND